VLTPLRVGFKFHINTGESHPLPEHPQSLGRRERRGTDEHEVRHPLRDGRGTIEDAWHTVTRKADAIRIAKQAAKTTVCEDVVRVWVDDLCKDLGVVSFTTKFA